MDYIELKIKFEPYSDEMNEIVAAFLSEIGFESTVDHPGGLLAYIPAHHFVESLIDFNFLPPKIKLDYTYSKIKQRNWNSDWEKNFKPVVLDNRCVIRAPFHDPLPRIKYDIIIEPKMSFGTGHHETTVLMMGFILDLDLRNKSLLDMGCGTGVLGILASMKGARQVDAVDNDQWAYENSLENMIRNQITNMEVIQGDASAVSRRQYDVILANINRNILLADMEEYHKMLLPDGKLIMSGFYMNDMPAILARAKDLGLSFEKFKSQNNWVAASFSSKNKINP
jgi:ribosomal protein L11 methyltransferase